MEKRVPILRSSAVLRPEYFGGFVFNHYLPPQLRLDHGRFKIASLCDGTHSLAEIYECARRFYDHSPEYVATIVRNTLGELETRFLLYWRDEKRGNPDVPQVDAHRAPVLNRSLSAPLGLIWELTHACNLRCRHCFSSSGRREANELRFEEIKGAIDSFAESRVLMINFTGGEPLMRRDLFDILRYASGKKISIDLSTNGYLVTEEIAQRLLDTNVFQVQISIDGLEEAHDRLRGAGSFRRAARAIEILRRYKFEVIVSTTANKRSIGQMAELIEWAADTGVSKFKTTLFIPVGRGEQNQDELILGREDVRRLAVLMRTMRSRLGGRMALHEENCFPWFLENGRPLGHSFPRSLNVCCAAGTSSLFITASGDVVPCPFLRDFVIGNLRDHDFTSLWRSEKLDVFRNLTPDDYQGNCRNCSYLGNKCYGGCRAAAFAECGDLYGEDPFCWKTDRKDVADAIPC